MCSLFWLVNGSFECSVFKYCGSFPQKFPFPNCQTSFVIDQVTTHNKTTTAGTLRHTLTVYYEITWVSFLKNVQSSNHYWKCWVSPKNILCTVTPLASGVCVSNFKTCSVLSKHWHVFLVIKVECRRCMKVEPNVRSRIQSYWLELKSKGVCRHT